MEEQLECSDLEDVLAASGLCAAPAAVLCKPEPRRRGANSTGQTSLRGDINSITMVTIMVPSNPNFQTISWRYPKLFRDIPNNKSYVLFSRKINDIKNTNCLKMPLPWSGICQIQILSIGISESNAVHRTSLDGCSRRLTVEQHPTFSAMKEVTGARELPVAEPGSPPLPIGEVHSIFSFVATKRQ